MTDEKKKEIIGRYERAAHGMQSGVAAKMNYDPTETTQKHLRVGVNSAMVEHAALVRLLLSKGLITDEEYMLAQATEMEEEKVRYEQWLTERLGKIITLG